MIGKVLHIVALLHVESTVSDEVSDGRIGTVRVANHDHWKCHRVEVKRSNGGDDIVAEIVVKRLDQKPNAKRERHEKANG